VTTVRTVRFGNGLKAGVVACLVGGALLATVPRGQDIVNPGGLPTLGRFFAAAAHPRIDQEFLLVVAQAMLTTVCYAVVGTAVSVVLGMAGALLTSRAWWGTPRRRGRFRAWSGLSGWWLGSRVLLAVPRGVHEVVWGLVLLSVLGLDPWVAVLAIGLPFGAVCTKVFSEILDEAPRGPFEALRAAGVGRSAAALYGLVPLAAPGLLSYAAYRFECAVRSATVLGLIGAGGVGFELALSFEALHYDEMWTLLGALVLLCALADRFSALVRRSHLRPTWWLLPAVGLVPVCVGLLALDPRTLVDRQAWELAGDLLATAWPPQGDWGSLLSLSVDTVAMSVIAATLSFTVALLLAFPAARTKKRRAGSAAGQTVRTTLGLGTRVVLLLLRAVPSPVWALLVLFVWFPGPLAGAIALASYNLGVLGRLLAEAVEGADDGPRRALTAAGASPAKVFLYADLPAVWNQFVAYGMYRWEVVVRETAVVGVVGAGGLGLLLSEQTASFHYAGVASTLIALVALTLLVDLLSAALRPRPGGRGGQRSDPRSAESSFVGVSPADPPRWEQAPAGRRSPRTP
jgi:phosphonate transport system permease protein